MTNTILVIEDEASLVKVLTDALKLEKFKVLSARNGHDGLALALKNHPDLILLDIVMPIMDGLEVLKKLRANSWGKTVPVIILSNLSEADKTAQAMEHGVHDYLVKTDWTLEQIVKQIKNRLKKRT